MTTAEARTKLHDLIESLPSEDATCWRRLRMRTPRTKPNTSALAAIWLVLASCTAPAPPLPLTIPNPTLARVYVIDDVSGLYGALPYDVVVDGRTVCTVRGEQFAVLDLDAGRHRFVLGGPGGTPQDFDVAAGFVTYLRVNIPKLREGASLVPMDEASATKAVFAGTRVETLLPSR
jgi:hypothetical protein